jgi:ADP-heptose:LPS heptosyltransferase
MLEHKNEQDLINTAIDYYHCGELNNALDTIKIIHEKFPHNLESHCLAAKIHYCIGHEDKSLEQYLAVLHKNPDHFEASMGLIKNFIEKNNIDASEMFLRDIYPNKKHQALILFAALCYADHGYYDLAAYQLKRVLFIEQDPKIQAEWREKLINWHMMSGDLISAKKLLLNIFDQSKQHDNNILNTLLSLAEKTHDAKLLKKLCHNTEIKKHPYYYFYQGRINTEEAKFKLAIDNYQKLINQYEGDSNQRVVLIAQYELSLLKILLGNYPEGWALHRIRKLIPENSHKFSFKPCWDGKESLKGKTITIVMEQAYGDMIMLLRYSELLSRLGATVNVHCDRALHTLVESNPWVNKINDHGDLYVYDFDLPYYFNTQINSIPTNFPYVFANPKKIETFSTLISSKKYRIGLCWQGSSKHSRDDLRSIPFDCFKPLFNLDHCQFYSLQHQAFVDCLFHAENIIELYEHIHDFGDLAAAIQCCDLVISVDTAIAHVTGALNRPGWVVLSSVPDWRWGIERDKCPWYPSLNLFRQQPGEDSWSQVIEQLARALTFASQPQTT